MGALMSVYKLAAGLAGVLCCAAMVTALAGVGSEPVRQATLKGDRLDIRETRAGAAQCPTEPWPFGCQWRETSSKPSSRVR